MAALSTVLLSWPRSGAAHLLKPSMSRMSISGCSAILRSSMPGRPTSSLKAPRAPAATQMIGYPETAGGSVSPLTYRDLQRHLALALGGEAGARLAVRSQSRPARTRCFDCGVDTRSAPGGPQPTPQVLGIDDWACRRAGADAYCICHSALNALQVAVAGIFCTTSERPRRASPTGTVRRGLRCPACQGTFARLADAKASALGNGNYNRRNYSR
jgi:hypothetical protein